MKWLTFHSDRLIVLLLEARRGKHSAAYSIPIVAVIAITCVRLLSGVDLVAELPFTTYFPAIVVAALIGGLGPSLVATLLISIIAWYPTVPDELGLEAGIWLLLLVLVTAVNVVIVAVLTAAVELSIRHKMTENPPNDNDSTSQTAETGIGNSQKRVCSLK